MAEYRTRLSEERTNLGEIAPLNQPYVLLLDPSNICNFRCTFCPSGDLELIKQTGRTQTIMDFELYKKIIDDTNQFKENIKVLRLYKEGEPLLNRRISDMVGYAKQYGNILRVDTTTNGVLLNPKLNREIIEAGIDQINISVNGVNADQIYKYTGTKVKFQQYVENIRDLFENKKDCLIYIKSIKENLTDEEQEQFYEIFGRISDRVFLENISPAWPDFEFRDIKMKFESGNYGQAIEDRKVCPYLFYIMVINSDGTVSTCVGDWSHKQLIGDTSKETLQEIWLGSILNSYWVDHLTQNKDKYYMCKRCAVIQYGSFDNIDDYANQILSRVDKNQN